MADWFNQKLLSILRSEGPQAPASLMARLKTSQSTLLRSVKAQPETILALGARINRKVAATRNVRGLGVCTPIFRITAAGEISPIGNLIAVYPTLFAVVLDAIPTKPQLYSGLPFFFDDMRPQGYLGRVFGNRHADLKLPARILDWGPDDILEALSRRGEDLVGDLMIGAESFERYQRLEKNTEIISKAHPETHYVRYAQLAEEGEPVGSSAGGENPKFGATLRDGKGKVEKVLVKFSPAGSTFAAERWRDLLICEAISLEVLNESGIHSARGRLLEGGGRTFLETRRFDRIGANGRKGILSLAALENEWVSKRGDWAASALYLEREKKISIDDLQTIRELECFGRLIGNSDRHSGNLSFFWSIDEKMAKLAPVYDMLPMLYAPNSRGEDTRRTFKFPSYDHTLLNAWKKALPMVNSYWNRIRGDSRLSKTFRKIAEQNLKMIL